jgi:hypothetical protein
MTHARRPRFLPLFLLALSSAAGGAAAGQRTPAGPPPGNAASLDFLAIAPDGLPVADLKADEVSLRIDGRARPIRSLQFVRIPAAVGPAEPDPELPAPFGSNLPDATGTRAMVLVVDDDSFRVGMERPLREATEFFLGSLAPSDRVALVTMPYGGTKVSLTTDHAKVKAAVAQVIGQAPQRESASDHACRSRRTLESLIGLLEGFSDAAPPVVLFFSAGLSGPTDSEIRSPRVMTGGQTIGMCDVPRDLFQQVGHAAAAAGARMYVIQPTSVASQVEGLEHVAGVTGGTMMHLGGSETNALSRVARETSGHYVAEFDVEPALRNGIPHRLELRVSRPAVAVRVRPSLTLPRATPSRALSPHDLLRQPKVFRDLRLRVSGFASREAGQKTVRVVVVGEAADGDVKIAGAAAGLFDQNGRLAGQWTARPEELSGPLVIGALAVAPGVYRLRLAATDANGRMGTADYDIEAQLTDAGPLKLSSLALGISRGSFSPRLQFTTEPVALAHVEIYGGTAGQPVSATFELARTPNGPALVSVPGALGALGDHHSASGAIPVGALPAGDYVVRAIVGVQGQPAGRVMRTLRKGK